MCSNAARTILLVLHIDREYCTRNSVVHALSFLSTTSLDCLFDKTPPVVSSGCLDYIVCDNYGRRMPPSWSPSYVRRRLEARLQYVSPLRTRPGTGYC